MLIAIRKTHLNQKPIMEDLIKEIPLNLNGVKDGLKKQKIEIRIWYQATLNSNQEVQKTISFYSKPIRISFYYYENVLAEFSLNNLEIPFFYLFV